MKWHNNKEQSFEKSGLPENLREAFYAGWQCLPHPLCGDVINNGEDSDSPLENFEWSFYPYFRIYKNLVPCCKADECRSMPYLQKIFPVVHFCISGKQSILPHIPKQQQSSTFFPTSNTSCPDDNIPCHNSNKTLQRLYKARKEAQARHVCLSLFERPCEALCKPVMCSFNMFWQYLSLLQ